MSPNWPLETLLTVTFAEHEGRTTLTVRWAPLNATELERETFEAGHTSMQQGRCTIAAMYGEVKAGDQFDENA